MLRDTGFGINRSNRGKMYDSTKLRIGISTFHHLHFIDECSSLILFFLEHAGELRIIILRRIKEWV